MKVSEEVLQMITQMVIEELEKKKMTVPVGISNRHVHLSREDFDILFGPGRELTRKKELRQPGQYAAEEVVTLKGPKGWLEKVRVLGPLRVETQIEISISDEFKLGVPAPIRESGHLNWTPGIELVGPAGNVKKDHGVIAALRHIHMTPDQAALMGVKDKETVAVDVGGRRGVILKNVLVRVSEQYALEMHVDVDEANACGMKNGDQAVVLPHLGKEGDIGRMIR